MASKAAKRFKDNKKDIDQLWKIHQEFAGMGAGRKYGVEVLNRAAIVFITACWESFIEDLALEAFSFIIVRAKTAESLPSKVKGIIGQKIIKESEDDRRLWKLADKGWKDALKDHMEDVKKKWIGNFNTPKSSQVNNLFEEMIGLRDLSSNWRWRGMSPKNAENKLDDYINIRGNIAHRITHDTAVYKDWGDDFLNHVTHLVAVTDNTVASFLQKLMGRPPW